MSEDFLATLTELSELGIYYGYAQVLPTEKLSNWTDEDSKVKPMVMSLGWNPFYKNEKVSAVSVNSIQFGSLLNIIFLQEVHIMHNYPSDFYDHPLRAIVLGYIRPESSYGSLGTEVFFS